MHDCLFNFVCCVAGESLTKATLGGVELLKQYKIQFDLAIQTASKRAEFINCILAFFPHNDFDDSFKRYVIDLSNRSPGEKFIKSKKLSDSDSEVQKTVFFGETIRLRHKDAKKEINNFVNPLWIEPSKLPSGFNRSSLLYSIRKRLWPKKAFDLAKLSVQKEFSRTNKGTNIKFRLDRSIEQVKAKITEKVFDINFYPSWWLVFIYLGRPTGQFYCRDGF